MLKSRVDINECPLVFSFVVLPNIFRISLDDITRRSWNATSSSGDGLESFLKAKSDELAPYRYLSAGATSMEAVASARIRLFTGILIQMLVGLLVVM